MKPKVQITLSVLFLVLINTAYWWEGWLSFVAMFAILFLAVCFLASVILIFVQLVQLIRIRFRDRPKVISMIISCVVALLVGFFPRGMINWDEIEGHNLLVASQESTANCTITIKLKENNRFIEKNVCFGVTTTRGTYTLEGDTVFFNSAGDYEYGVLHRDEKTDTIAGMMVYRNKADTSGYPLSVKRDELSRKNVGQ